MSTSRHQQVRQLFEEALTCPVDARAAFLANAAGGDAALVAEVESLLAAHDAAGGFLETPAGALGSPERLSGRRIGPYELLRELARGGMGAVYVARRADDAYNRRVAVKLIRPGMDSEAVLRRFRAERQILASLDHPHIARLLDGGITPDGRPYLVMEYVEGRPIDQVCEAGNFSIAERLELFRTVCGAVSHAHRNLVVHRDLKPANILVTADGAPKLLDFGIAKLLNPDLAGMPDAPTATAMRVMTPEYASPEQARGDAITTASDIYSLGVVLYQLLTGQRPYDLRGKTPGEVERAICESEPSRPSVAVQETRPVAGLGPVAQLRRRLEGDLDAIVMKALRKEPQHRYGTVDQLADDLARYLRHEPVAARRGSWRYYAGKFVRRNRIPVMAGAAALAALAVGVVATSHQATVAERERAKAERLLADVRSLATSFLFEFHDEIERLPGATPARELVVRRALEYLDRLAAEAGDDPTLQLELASGYGRLGNIQWARYYANLGDLSGAAESQRKALAIREAVVAAHPDNLDARRDLGFSYVNLGDAVTALGRLDEGLQLYRKALDVREALVADHGSRADERSLAITYQRLGDLLGNPSQENLGDWAAALGYFHRMQAIFERHAARPNATLDERHSVGIGYEKLGRVAAASGDLEGALAYYQRELEAFRADFTSDSSNGQLERDLAVGYGNVGDALVDLGRHAAALEPYEAARRIRTRLLAADPRNMGALADLAFIDRALGVALVGLGRHAEGIARMERAVAGLERVYAVDPANRWIRGQLAGTLVRAAEAAQDDSRPAAARAGAARALEILRRATERADVTPDDFDQYARELLFTPVTALRDPAAAVTAAERAVAAGDGRDPDHLDTLAKALHRAGDRTRAIATARRALELLPAGDARRAGLETTLEAFGAGT